MIENAKKYLYCTAWVINYTKDSIFKFKQNTKFHKIIDFSYIIVQIVIGFESFKT